MSADEQIVKALEPAILQSLDAADYFQRTGSTERLMQALRLRDDLAAVLEPIIRAREAKTLRDAARLLAAEGHQLTHMPSDGVRRKTYAQIVNRLRGWAGSGMPKSACDSTKEEVE